MKIASSPLVWVSFALVVARVGLAAPPLPGPVPSSPSEPVAIPVESPPRTPASPLPEVSAKLTLAEVVSIALATNPQTRASWLAAQAAAAQVGRKRAAYYPRLDASIALTRVSQWALGGRFGFQQTTYGPSLSLTYLLLDLGGRGARVQEAFQALLAADFAHNATVQEVIFQVEQAYFAYLAAEALQEAAKKSLEDAEKHLEAAKTRKDVGLATALDVMQARTAVAEAKLQLASLVGQLESVRGSLATAMGYSATVPVSVAAVLPEVEQLQELEKVEELVAQALLDNPEVQAARARQRQAEAKVAATRSEGLPALALSAGANRTYYLPQGVVSYRDNWSLGVNLRLPLFTGYDQYFAVKQAEFEAQEAQATRIALEQKVTLEVWTAYSNLNTARAKLGAAQELLTAATQTQEVAQGRYREGVGSMLDLTQAQAILARARAEHVQARADYLLSVAALARACGRLKPPSPSAGKGD